MSDANRSIFDLIEYNINNHDKVTNPKTITFLFGLLLGYRFALNNHNIQYTDIETRFDEFQDWLVQRIDVRDGECFLHALLRMCESETIAYQKFFDLLDEYTVYVKYLTSQ